MNPPGFPSGEPSPSSSKKQLQLRGPRPPLLNISKESHKRRRNHQETATSTSSQHQMIMKPPLPKPAARQREQATKEPIQQRRQPVIIYSVSPKVITVDSPSDFMDLVQRLTGQPCDDNKTPAGPGDVSPAARLVSIEKTSPTDKEKTSQSREDDMSWMLGQGVEMGQFPGILMPEPEALPPIYPEWVWDPQAVSYFDEYWSTSSFLTSPSGFLPAPVVSPQPSPNLFNIFD